MDDISSNNSSFANDFHDDFEKNLTSEKRTSVAKVPNASVKVEEIEQLGSLDRIKNCLFPSIQKIQRTVRLNGEVSPSNYMKNKIRNQKYSIITFLPVVLYNQFKFFYNLFYLFLSISQFIPPLKVGKQCSVAHGSEFLRFG